MGLNRGLVKRVGLGLVALSVVSGISTRTGVGPLRIVPVAADTTTATPAGTVTPAGTATVGASPAGTESFLVTEASVAATDGLPAGSEHQSFTINCAGAQASPTWMTDGTAPTCTNGQLTIDVSPATHYYDSQNDVGEYCPSAGTGCAYVPSNYDVVIQAGQTLRIGGSWVREQYSSYQFTANYIWNPGANVTNPPPDPRPSTVQDYAFEHRFVVDGAVVQAGSGLPGAQLWSQKWGIVLGQIPTTTNATTGTNGYSGNTQVAAIAAAHQDPTTGDPQLVINMVDTSPANQISYAIPLTRYWVQDSGGQYIPASKADATTCTASYPCAAGTEPEVEVAGSYGWLNGDWVFLAEFVWRPMPGLQPGYYSFNEDSTLTTSTAAGSTDTEGWYDGSSVSGPGDVNPAGVTFDITWSATRRPGS